MAAVLGAFDQFGERYATLSVDGRLKVWDCATGNISHTYTPPTHLADTFTCLTWEAPEPDSKTKPSSPKQSVSQIALGTLSGRIVLYDVALGSEVVVLSGHTERVNDVAFVPGTDRLLSCADDRHIVQWDLSTGKKVSQWKADDQVVQRICVSNDGKLVLSAGRTLKLWELGTRKLIKSYAGHATTVTSLAVSANMDYAVSMAEGERFLDVWALAATAPTTALATLALQSSPKFMSVGSGKSLTVLAVDEDGKVLLWWLGETVATTTKPVQPKTSVRLVSTVNKATAIPATATTLLCSSAVSQIIIAWGGALAPVFDRVAVTDVEGNPRKNFILRRNPARSSLGNVGTDKKQPGKKEPRPKPVKMVMAETSVGVKSATAISDERNGAKSESLGERLQQLAEASEKETEKPTVPKADSLGVLLVQALHSGDSQLLEECLRNTRDKVVGPTVARLKAPQIITFLQELSIRFEANPNRGNQLLPWIKATLLTHTAYLASVPNLRETLGPLYQTVDSRLAVFNKLLDLNGRLEVLLSQVTVGPKQSKKGKTKPGEVYKDSESSADEEDPDTEMQTSDKDDVDDENDENKAESDGKESENEEESETESETESEADNDDH